MNLGAYYFQLLEPVYIVYSEEHIGLHFTGKQDPVEAYETMTHVAQAAEGLGYDSIWLYDHFHTVPVPTQEVTFECWTSSAALARDTRRVRCRIDHRLTLIRV